jgi:hypothetical protein
MRIYRGNMIKIYMILGVWGKERYGFGGKYAEGRFWCRK